MNTNIHDERNLDCEMEYFYCFIFACLNCIKFFFIVKIWYFCDEENIYFFKKVNATQKVHKGKSNYKEFLLIKYFALLFTYYILFITYKMK